MAQAKTRATAASVADYLASRATPGQLADCKALMALMRRVTGKPPRMWGPSIVGYGSYRYELAGGRNGESCLTGFAVRGRELVVYLVSEGAGQRALLGRLGKHRIGRACLYIKRLADLDVSVLEQLVRESVAETRRRALATS
jgi:hypothetical protein